MNSAKNKQSSINVQGTAISIISHSDDDYICITDIRMGLSQSERLKKLNAIAISQLQSLAGRTGLKTSI